MLQENVGGVLTKLEKIVKDEAEVTDKKIDGMDKKIDGIEKRMASIQEILEKLN